MSDTVEMRHVMVSSQIRPCDTSSGASETIMQAFNRIPREKFVPRQLRRIAYMDDEFPLLHGRFMLRPQVFSRMLSAANPRAQDRVLHVGCGLGYGSAILSELCDFVVGLESCTDLSQQAEATLSVMEAQGIEIVNGPLTGGWNEYSPYSLIVIEGKIEFCPEEILNQLQDQGRIVAIKQQLDGRSEAVLIQKNQEVFTEIPQFDAHSPFLEGFALPQEFVFAD